MNANMILDTQYPSKNILLQFSAVWDGIGFSTDLLFFKETIWIWMKEFSWTKCELCFVSSKFTVCSPFVLSVLYWMQYYNMRLPYYWTRLAQFECIYSIMICSKYTMFLNILGEWAVWYIQFIGHAYIHNYLQTILHDTEYNQTYKGDTWLY